MLKKNIFQIPTKFPNLASCIYRDLGHCRLNSTNVLHLKTLTLIRTPHL